MLPVERHVCVLKSPGNQNIMWLLIQTHNITNMAVIGNDYKIERLV